MYQYAFLSLSLSVSVYLCICCQGWVRVSDSIQQESFTVHNLKPETSYIFVVRAQNAYGVSEPSAPSDPIEIEGKNCLRLR